MSQSAPTVQEFEPEFIAALTQMFEERIVFNQLLGLKVLKLTPTSVECRIDMKPDLVGHYAYQRLHGGVISAGLDAVAGLAVMSAIAGKHMAEPVEQRLARFGKLGTIDLRVDYLRQATGPHFFLKGQALRVGSRVATTRMEFIDAQGQMLAAGAAAYIVS